MPSTSNGLKFLLLALLIGAAFGQSGCQRWVVEPPPADEEAGPLTGAPLTIFSPSTIGTPIAGTERPQIANVQIADLDDDGFPDVIVCDAMSNHVGWIRQFPAGTYTERTLGDPVPAPAFAHVVDFDGDGDLDIAVASLGVLLPNNQRIGSVVMLENDGQQRFTNHVVASRIARVAHVNAADLDRDGRLDIAVAGFGYDSGETLWLRNKGGWQFELHELQRFAGPINAIVADVNGDTFVDIVTLVSQDSEDLWAFVNDGHGNFTVRMIWGSTNPDFGSSWISVADLDRDGDPDLLYSNGDALDYAPNNSRPWHGVQWLENKGNVQFEYHRIGELSGASSPQAADVDNDGDTDIVVVSAYNDWDDPAAISVALLENDGRMRFTRRAIADSPTHVITVGVADMDGDRRLDLVTGGLHLTRPFNRMSRVTLWTHGEPPASR